MAKKNKETSVSISRSDLRDAAKSNSTALSSGFPGFVPAAEFQKPEGAIVRTMSPMIKPKEFPVGQVLVGKFTRIFPTSPGQNEDGSAKIGEGVEIIPDGSDIGVSLPAVATLRMGLDLQGKGREATSPFIGRTVAIQLMANKLPSKKGNEAWNFVVSVYPENYQK